MQEENYLLEKAKQGDADAFCALLEPYQNKIYSLALRFFKNEQDAQDAGQDALLKMFRFIQNFKGDSAFSTWVYSVTKNTCLDMLRKHKRNKEDVAFDGQYLQLSDDTTLPEKIALQNEELSILARLIQQMPETQREILVLRDIDGYTYDEIAQILNLNLGTVKSRLARARGTLRAAYSKSGKNFI